MASLVTIWVDLHDSCIFISEHRNSDRIQLKNSQNLSLVSSQLQWHSVIAAQIRITLRSSNHGSGWTSIKLITMLDYIYFIAQCSTYIFINYCMKMIETNLNYSFIVFLTISKPYTTQLVYFYQLPTLCDDTTFMSSWNVIDSCSIEHWLKSTPLAFR